MKKTVILYKKIPDIQRNRLEEEFNLIYFNGINETNKLEFITALKQADGIIGASFKFTSDLLSYATKLKAISTISVGYDNFNVSSLTAKGIRLMHTPNVLTDTTADTIFMLLLMTARRAVELSMLVRNKLWNKSIDAEYYGIDVHHKTIGIIGMGRIGQAIAKRAFCGFDMPVIYSSHTRCPQVEQLYHAQYYSLDELLQNADFVCITLPLNSSTEKLISAEKLDLMKPTSILINGSRGRIIDEEALIRALQSKQIQAAGLDVFEVEPLPSNSPLMLMSNVVVLPHIGSATIETRTKMVDCAIDNLIAAFEKNTLPINNLVNPEADNYRS